MGKNILKLQRFYTFRKECFWNSADPEDTFRKGGTRKVLMVEQPQIIGKVFWKKVIISKFVAAPLPPAPRQAYTLVFIWVKTFRKLFSKGLLSDHFFKIWKLLSNINCDKKVKTRKVFTLEFQ